MKAKLTIGHDRLRLNMRAADGADVNINISRSGVSVSGRGVSRGQLQDIMSRFDGFMKPATYGERLKSMEAIAQASEGFDDFLAAISV